MGRTFSLPDAHQAVHFLARQQALPEQPDLGLAVDADDLEQLQEASPERVLVAGAARLDAGEEGLATAVLRLIEVRFGAPSSEVAARVREAEDHELLAMIDRSVDAPSAEHIVGLRGTDGTT